MGVDTFEHYGDPPDDPEQEFDLDGRCLYCLRVLPADGLCRCGASLAELERARLALRIIPQVES